MKSSQEDDFHQIIMLLEQIRDTLGRIESLLIPSSPHSVVRVAERCGLCGAGGDTGGIPQYCTRLDCPSRVIAG